jgi:uncharacterized protein (TIGR03067 family)
MNTDLEKLQGTWHIVEMEMDGQKMPAAASTGAKIVLKGEAFTTVSMGATYEGTVELNSTTTPKTFDLIFTKGPEKGNRSLGIYELDSETWKICLTTAGSNRPSCFTTAPKSGLALEILKRAPAAAGPASEPAAPPPGLDLRPVPELEGEWTMVSCVRDGEPVERMMLKYGKRVDRANRVTVSFGPQVVFQAHYMADLAANPKTIDFVHAEGPNASRSQLGILELDGAELKLCYAAPGDPRPSDYLSARGDGRTVAVWKRMKK